MKHFFFTFSLLSMLMIGSCTSEPNLVEDEEQSKIEIAGGFVPVQDGSVVQGGVDFEILSRYTGGLEDATYTIAERKLYRKDELTKGAWELDTNIYYGAESPLPYNIVVRDGKVWQPVRLYHCAYGSTAFARAISAVNIKQNKEYYAYASRQFDVDEENYTLKIDRMTYGISIAEDDVLLISAVTDFEGGRTHNGGSFLEFGCYNKVESLKFDDGKNLGFDSVVAAYDWLIEEFEATFGEVVNLNELYAPTIRFDQPYFYLSKLKEERNKVAQE